MSRDPEGKAALFGSSAAESDGEAHLGRASHSSGAGPVLITCSDCNSGSRVSYRDLAVRMLRLSLWNPQRDHAHWILCPSCGRRNWCRVSL